MSISATQWREIERRLSVPYSVVKLRVPGHELTIEVRQLKPLRYAPVLFVDGRFEGKWARENCEDPAAQLYPLRSRRLVQKSRAEAYLKRLKRVFQAETARQLSGIDARYSWRQPDFPSPRAICAWLKRQPEIELIGELP